MAFRRLPTSPFLLGRDPPALLPKSLGEVGVLGETISGTSCREAQVDGRSLHERIVLMTIVTGSSPRLAHRHLEGFLLLFLELVNGLAKNIR